MLARIESAAKGRLGLSKSWRRLPVRPATFAVLLAIALPLVEAPTDADAAEQAQRPNIVVILADDLGYGDVKCLNPEGKIATPNMDRLAAGGMIFTDAHSSSSVCTPTRYGVLTGRYNWRSRLQSHVQGGCSPRLIEPGRMTVAAMLKQHGYRTAGLGKWHLGMDWALKPGAPKFGDNIEDGAAGWNVDFTKPIANGPNSLGFDYYFGISASLDMVPYTFIENDHVVALPTIDKVYPLMLGREGGKTREGPGAEEFDAMQVLPTLTEKAVGYIGQRAADAKAGQPFFLYLPLNAPHTPILPTPEWQGKSGLNPYADFVMQTDATIGAVLDALDKHNLTGDTLVILTSDNGCSPQAKFDELLAKDHNPSYVFRGTKADIFDGGHRIPFIARWPGKIKAASTSDQLVCLTDVMATCAEIIGFKLPDDAGEDSVSLLPAFEGRATAPLREAVVHHSINGSFAIRQGRWKLELCPDSGGWSAPRPGQKGVAGLPPVQLYDLSQDIGERKNVEHEHPEIVARLTKLLEKYIANGRSTPGAKQKNTVDPKIRKTAAR
ncbi:MAG TPA: arylsulfatase [Pirellulales bacterium]|nr:arylsulfatase [Pirellulales bacterium]